MVLHIDSDASYLSLPHARSRAEGHYYLSNASPNPSLPPTNSPKRNAAIYTLCKRLRNVLTSTTEAKLTALFHNGQEAAVIRITLMEMGHRQPPTPIKTDNSTANGIANRTVIPRKTRSIDMSLYWVINRVTQKQFIIYWKPGNDNLADYFSKHHPPTHHKHMRYEYVQDSPVA